MNTIAANGNIYDEHGNVVGRVDPHRIPNLRGPNLAGLGAGYIPWGSIGGDIWEFFHASTVQQEYTAVGKDAPSLDEITQGAAADASAQVEQGLKDAASGVMSAGKWLVIGLIAVAAFELLKHLPKPKKGRR